MKQEQLNTNLNFVNDLKENKSNNHEILIENEPETNLNNDFKDDKDFIKEHENLNKKAEIISEAEIKTNPNYDSKLISEDNYLNEKNNIIINTKVQNDDLINAQESISNNYSEVNNINKEEENTNNLENEHYNNISKKLEIIEVDNIVTEKKIEVVENETIINEKIIEDTDIVENNEINMESEKNSIYITHEDTHNYVLDETVSVVFLIYAPGTNKDDVLYPSFKKKSFLKISTGELLKTYCPDLVKLHKEISGEIVVNLLIDFIEANKNKCTRYLICGFPRSEENSSYWKKLIGKKYSVTALIYVSYTRKEHETELRERSEKDGKTFDAKHVAQSFEFFIKSTAKVFDDFGEKKLIRVTAKMPDMTIISTIMKNELISKKYLN